MIYVEKPQVFSDVGYVVSVKIVAGVWQEVGRCVEDKTGV